MKGRTGIKAYCRIYTYISLGSRFGGRRVPLQAATIDDIDYSGLVPDEIRSKVMLDYYYSRLDGSVLDFPCSDRPRVPRLLFSI